jgi:glycosyltransferase involved in cell wall biosynthesis
MTIAVNCRFLEREMRGIGRYASALAGALRGARPDVECVVSRRVAPHLEPEAAALGARRVGPLSGPVWEQLTLPVYLAARGRPLLLNFVNTAPLLYGPQVTVVYDLAYLRHPETFSASFLRLYRTVVPRAVARSRVVVTISEFVRRELVATFGVAEERVSVVPCFVAPGLRDLARADSHRRPPITVAGEYALVVGSLNARKNLRAAIAAFRRAAVPDLRLVVVGEGGDVFRRVDLDDDGGRDVVFVGSVSDAELVRLYKGARLLLFPSLYEGFGMPPIEAMVCGCPVVAAKAASLPEVCADAAYYFDPVDVGEMAAAIAAVANDGTVRDTLRRRGHERAARYTLDASFARFQAVVDGVLTELAPRPRPAARRVSAS